MQSHIKISGRNTFINIFSENKYNKVTPGFPGGTTVRNPSANSEDAGDASFIHGLGRSPGAGNDNLSSILEQCSLSLLPAFLHGQRSLAGYSPWGCTESDTTKWLNIRTLLPIRRFAVVIYHLKRGNWYIITNSVNIRKWSDNLTWLLYLLLVLIKTLPTTLCWQLS